MTVLVTGAGGRIGRHVTRLLLDSGRTVRGLVLPDDPSRAWLEAQPGVEVVEGRLEDAASLRPAVEGVEGVIHLAAALTSRGGIDDEFFAANAGGTYHLLAAIRDTGTQLKRLVYISSDAVYWGGAGPAFSPVDESHPRIPASVYGATKVAAEELCLTFQRAYGVPVTIVRPSATADAEELIDPDGVFGSRMFVHSAIQRISTHRAPGSADLELLAALRAVDDGTRRLYVVADPEGRTSISTLNDARDGATGIVLALDSPLAVGEAFNIGPAAPYAESELVGHIGERLGVSVTTIAIAGARPSWIVSSAKARTVLGYRPARTVLDMVDEALAARGDAR
ncbi:MAG: NAD(P)-dependent oxidoreductase [Chloroflexota bacterium]